MKRVRAAVKQLNEQGRLRGGAALDLAGADLGPAALPGVRIEFASVAATNARGADLSGATIRFADLSTIDLSGANLADARLEQCSLVGADLSEALLSGARFSACDLRGAQLDRAKAPGAFFAHCCATDARFRGADLKGARFLESTLENVDWSGADLSRVLMPGCPVEGAALEQTRGFAFVRELVGEVLRAAAGEDVGLLAAALLAGRRKEWCWPEWRERLEHDPELRHWARSVFERHPDSRLVEALDGRVSKSGEASR